MDNQTIYPVNAASQADGPPGEGNNPADILVREESLHVPPSPDQETRPAIEERQAMQEEYAMEEAEEMEEGYAVEYETDQEETEMEAYCPQVEPSPDPSPPTEVSEGPATAPSYQSSSQAPFVAELFRQELGKQELGKGAAFRPAARLVLTPALRTAELWQILPAEELKTLLLILTFLTPNGWCRPTLFELAQAMRVSERKARERLDRLCALNWRGQPVVRQLVTESGMQAFVPSRAVLALAEAPTGFAAPSESLSERPIRPAGREAVIEYSRARYARPRAEVEADIARRMGWDKTPWVDPAVRRAELTADLSDEQRGLLPVLEEHGLYLEQALDFLARFDPDRIRRQLEWLPLRRAKSPLRFLLAAIEGDYDPPPALRRPLPSSMARMPSDPIE